MSSLLLAAALSLSAPSLGISSSADLGPSVLRPPLRAAVLAGAGAGAGGNGLQPADPSVRPFDGGVMLAQGLLGVGGGVLGGAIGGMGGAILFPGGGLAAVVPVFFGMLGGAWIGFTWASWAVGEAAGLRGNLGLVLLVSALGFAGSVAAMAALGALEMVTLGGPLTLLAVILTHHATAGAVSGLKPLGAPPTPGTKQPARRPGVAGLPFIRVRF